MCVYIYIKLNMYNIYLSIYLFIYLSIYLSILHMGFLSETFTNGRTAVEVASTSWTFRHSPDNYCRDFTSAHS